MLSDSSDLGDLGAFMNTLVKSAPRRAPMIAKEKCVLVVRCRSRRRAGRAAPFLKGQSGNPKGGFRKGRCNPGSRQRHQPRRNGRSGRTGAGGRDLCPLVATSDFERRSKSSRSKRRPAHDLTQPTALT